MENYYWTTENPHSTNEETMHDFIDNHCELDIIEHDGTFATGKHESGVLWGIYAYGNGDFCNHMVSFEQLT